jgi:hypothetical protein
MGPLQIALGERFARVNFGWFVQMIRHRFPTGGCEKRA